MRAANVLAAVLVGTVTLAGARALAHHDNGSAHDAPVVPKLIWTDCGGGFQCATAKVPLDYGRPSARTIDIALVRRPAADPANRIGSLFLNPGGPGGLAVEFVRTAPPPAFRSFGQFDIVGFDPRGLGASQPAVLDCGDDPSYRVPMPRTSTVDNKTFLAKARNYGETCRKLNGEILPHVSTANVARDLDLLRGQSATQSSITSASPMAA